MLRSTRPLLSSSRAIASQKPSNSSLRRLPIRVATTPLVAHPLVPRTALAELSPLIPKTRYATRSPSGFQKGIDPEEDKRVAQRKLKVHPETVTSESTVRHIFEPDEHPREKPITDGVKADLETVKDTFALSTVPKESYYLGLAGTLPYLATSISTVYLSWNLNTEWPSSSSFVNSIIISHDTARQLLDTIEPLQLGYGAIIISFLGAIHWGLEYAEKTPSLERTRFRYGLGVLASVVAWPTLLMPVEFALTSQFAAFVALYFADVRATIRGWTPSWYGTYRFVLTAVVGVAIVISLIGRAKVGDAQPRLTGLDEKFRERRGEEDYTEKWKRLEQEEKLKIKKEQEEAEKRRKEEEKQVKGDEKNAKKQGKDDDETKKSGDVKKENEDKKEGKK
ncbi:hypothetical protein F5X99DRAFT_395278 [Biscogniauxia marginata]|nr:hypothetical protein F5X99DRAFT_395278 [Biscogniauxia marginata]